MALSVADLEARFNDPLLLDSGAHVVTMMATGMR
jgi:hypothetical protein